MKKKILSTLLAVAMFASVAVPAFASNTSTQEGDPAKITMLEFRKDGKPLTSIDIKEDEEVDLEQYLMAWEDKDTLVLDKNQIVWEIRDTQSVFTMDSEGHIVATEPKGSATVIARDGEKEKVVAKLTVNAKPNNKETYANSWKFSSANYDVIYDNPVNDKSGRAQESEGLEMKVVAVPEGSILTPENKKEIEAYVKDEIVSLLKLSNGATTVTEQEVTQVKVRITADSMSVAAPAPSISRIATTPTSIDVSFGAKNKAAVVLGALLHCEADAVEDNATAEFVMAVDGGTVAFEVKADTTDKSGNTLLFTATEVLEDLSKDDVRTALGFEEGEAIVDVYTVKVPVETVDRAAITDADRAKVEVSSDDTSITFKVGEQYLTEDIKIKEGEKKGLTAKVPFFNKDNKEIKTVTAKTNLITKRAINTTKVSVLPNKTIEVGETFKIKDTLGYGNSKANVLKSVKAWTESPLNNDAAVSDYAIVGNIGEDNEGIVTGVKTGKNRIYVTLEHGMEAYCTVTVVPKGTVDKIDDHNAVLKVKDVTVTVGGTQWIDMYNIDADSIVKWTSSDEAIAKIVGNSENKGAKVWGLKEGTATLTLTVDGDVAATLNVTVKGAATTPSKPDATGNAQTGDTLFSNLF